MEVRQAFAKVTFALVFTQLKNATNLRCDLKSFSSQHNFVVHGADFYVFSQKEDEVGTGSLFAGHCHR